MAKRKSDSSANSGKSGKSAKKPAKKSAKKPAARRTPAAGAPGAGTSGAVRSPGAQGQMLHEDELLTLIQSAQGSDEAAFEACLDLADSNASLETRIIFLRRAVELGRELLGQNFEQKVGEFWLAPETRPFMHAKAALAHALSENNELAEAAVQLSEMLQLNPNDNQGARWDLVPLLLQLELEDDVEKLLDCYPEEAFALWPWARLLLAIRRSAPAAERARLLAAARKANDNVAAYLTGARALPHRFADLFSFGDENEAALVALSLLGPWRETEGATSWLRQALAGPKATSGAASEAAAPACKWDPARILTAPLQPKMVWQLGVLELPSPIEEQGELLRPTVVMLFDPLSPMVLGFEMTTAGLSTGLVLQLIGSQILEPQLGPGGYRPGRIEVRSLDERVALEPTLKEWGIEVVVGRDFEELDRCFEGMFQHFEQGEGFPDFSSIPGADPSEIDRFVEAAAAFYKVRPWRAYPADFLIEVFVPEFMSAPWYCCPMGQQGSAYGLSLYAELSQFEQLRQEYSEQLDETDDEAAVAAVGAETWSVLFNEAGEVPPADLRWIEARGLPVAGESAFPSTFHLQRGEVEQVDRRSLVAITLCLQAVEQAARQRSSGNKGPMRLELPGWGRLVQAQVRPV
ncbi:MAG: DUF6930 domain-containing protein [Pirellulaceae bacterium]